MSKLQGTLYLAAIVLSLRDKNHSPERPFSWKTLIDQCNRVASPLFSLSY
jgi:hypothetical protein